LCVSPFGGVTAEQIHRDFPLETSKEVWMLQGYLSECKLRQTADNVYYLESLIF
jgi:hypothetical protein